MQKIIPAFALEKDAKAYVGRTLENGRGPEVITGYDLEQAETRGWFVLRSVHGPLSPRSNYTVLD